MPVSYKKFLPTVATAGQAYRGILPYGPFRRGEEKNYPKSNGGPNTKRGTYIVSSKSSMVPYLNNTLGLLHTPGTF